MALAMFGDGAAGGALAGAEGAAGWAHVAIDDVLTPREWPCRVRCGDDVFDRNEAQCTGPIRVLDRDIGDPRAFAEVVARRARVSKNSSFATGPHPARQRHRRQETAAGRMAVGAKHRHREHRLRQAPMRGPGRRVAGFGFTDVLEQRRAQTHHEMRGDDVGGLGALADPLAQMVEVEFSRQRLDCLRQLRS